MALQPTQGGSIPIVFWNVASHLTASVASVVVVFDANGDIPREGVCFARV